MASTVKKSLAKSKKKEDTMSSDDFYNEAQRQHLRELLDSQQNEVNVDGEQQPAEPKQEVVAPPEPVQQAPVSTPPIPVQTSPWMWRVPLQSALFALHVPITLFLQEAVDGRHITMAAAMSHCVPSRVSVFKRCLRPHEPD